MDTETGVQILVKAVYISQSANILGKGLIPILLSPVMSK